ncbi:LuxR family transcriptional regulator [Mycobacterium sp. PSTR-4-N]|uniref:helix-turn-helix transcriptional regulator n=1 Tax=Mycobacterium sp. PSTR-4-N TaxID=2917745 RepID=UPI001F14E932|nr:LuxR family transcriptional regulator [Mycobacterium sp. PSTR-4-N]MCG7592727.1 AAA family ATPase [Mycobacterium sp. PSTR-4-N]
MPGHNAQSRRAVLQEAEAEALRVLLDTASSGPVGLIVEGEAGIGKTTFALQARDAAAARGFRVLLARGTPSEVTLAFAGLADLLTDIDEAVVDGLVGVQRDALNRILLRGHELPAADERAAGAAMHAVLRHLATRTPLLVIIDDLQWLDPSSATAVRYALRRVSQPFGVLVTVRSGERDALSSVPWVELAIPGAVRRITMSPSTFGGLHALLASHVGRVPPRPTMRRIHEISGGNPFYALELARAVDEGVPIDRRLPDSLAALVEQRVKHVGPDASDALLAAACTPAPTVDVVARAIGRRPDAVIDVLERDGAAARIVVLVGQSIRFAHPLLASGVYAAAEPGRRREMHRRLADVVDSPELKARHLASAATRADETTLTALDVASAAAREQGAPAAAAELLSMAIDLGGDTPVRRLLAARYLFEAGNISSARALLADAPDRLPSGTLRGAALMLRGALDGYDGSFDAAVAGLSAGVAEVRDEPRLRLQGLMLLAQAISVAGRLDEGVDVAREAVACADGIGDDASRSQARAVWVGLKFRRGLGRDTAELTEALRLQGDEHPTHVNMRADAISALIDSWSGDLDRAVERMAAIRAECVERGSELDTIWLDQHLVTAYVWSGEYGAAARIADGMAQHGEQIGGHQTVHFALTARALVAAHRGEADAARADALAAIDLAERAGGRDLAVTPLACLGFLDVSLGDHASAMRTYATLLSTFRPGDSTELPTAGWLPDAIEALTALQRVDEAEQLTNILWDNGHRLDRPWMLATAARGRALVCAARGDLEGAEAAAVTALTFHERLPIPLEKARTQLVLGQLQRRQRRRQAAAATVAEAVSTFENLGARLWQHRAEAELSRLTGARDNTTLLTPAEERVARHAAAGLSNNEIATELFLSPKTVEMNLSKVYRKLGIRSRAQLHSRLRDARENPDSQPAHGR